jgi:uncharacterized repeat protein (TIGR02543 family)
MKRAVIFSALVLVLLSSSGPGIVMAEPYASRLAFDGHSPSSETFHAALSHTFGAPNQTKPIPAPFPRQNPPEGQVKPANIASNQYRFYAGFDVFQTPVGGYGNNMYTEFVAASLQVTGLQSSLLSNDWVAFIPINLAYGTSTNYVWFQFMIIQTHDTGTHMVLENNPTVNGQTSYNNHCITPTWDSSWGCYGGVGYSTLSYVVGDKYYAQLFVSGTNQVMFGIRDETANSGWWSMTFTVPSTSIVYSGSTFSPASTIEGVVHLTVNALGNIPTFQFDTYTGMQGLVWYSPDYTTQENPNAPACPPSGIDTYQLQTFWYGYWRWTGLSGRSSGGCSASPSIPTPTITNVVYPTSITQGQTATITIYATNNGPATASWQSIHVSFPQNPPPSSIAIDGSSTVGSPQLHKPGDPPISASYGWGGTQASISYPFVEGSTGSWSSGVTKQLVVRVTPPSTGQFKFYVKTVAAIQNDVLNWNPTIGTSIGAYPGRSSGGDQQSEFVYEFQIQVNPPQYTLSIGAGSGGTTNPSPGNIQHYAGDPISVSYSITVSGYTFAGWSVSGASCSGGSMSPTCQFTMPSNAVSVTANFNPPTFQFSISTPGSQSTSQGGSPTFSFTVTTTSGTPQSVTLSLLNQPAGTSLSWSQNPVIPSNFGGTSVTLTISTGCSTVAQTYSNLQISGSGGGASAASNFFGLTVSSSSSCQVFGFSISTPPSPLMPISQGASATFTFTVTTTSGTPRPVTLSLVNQPPGTSLSWNPGQTITPSTSGTTVQLTIQTSCSTPAQSYSNLQISGSSGGTSASSNYFTLTVTANPSCSIQPGSLIVADYGSYPHGQIQGAIYNQNPNGGSPIAIYSGTPYMNISDVAIDGSGNLIVADAHGSIFRQSPSGGAPTVIYSGAPYVTPNGIAVDSSGYIIVSDCGAKSIFRQSPNGGSPTVIYSGAPYVCPGSMTIDASGSIIVVDPNAHGLYRQNPSGGQPTAIFVGAPYVNPSGVAIDSSGNIIVTDGNGKILRQSPSGGAPTVIYSGTPYAFPDGVAIDSSGNLIVADWNTPGVFRQSPNGGAPTVIYSGAPYIHPSALRVYSSTSGQSSLASTSVTVSTPLQYSAVLPNQPVVLTVVLHGAWHELVGVVRSKPIAVLTSWSPIGILCTTGPDGKCQVTLTAPAAGSYSVTASFAGDANFQQSTSAPMNLIVGGAQTSTTATCRRCNGPVSASVPLTPTAPNALGTASTTLTLSPLNSVSAGQPVVSTVLLAGSWNELVGVVTNKSVLVSASWGKSGTCTTGPNGMCQVPLVAPAAGSYSVAASFAGDTNFPRSSSTINLIVGGTQTSTTVGCRKCGGPISAQPMLDSGALMGYLSLLGVAFAVGRRALTNAYRKQDGA